jgi:hypothetical protein
VRYLSTSLRAPRWLLLFGATSVNWGGGSTQVNAMRPADDPVTVLSMARDPGVPGSADAAQAEVARWRSVRFVLPNAAGVPELSVVSVDDR